MAKKPFVVLDAEILSSSIWSEASHVRLVWITLLVLCDLDGYVGASVPGIAKAAGVPLAEAESALERLQGPDPYSRTRKDEGRRLRKAERGWQILNFTDHVDRLSKERRKTRERVRKWRAHGTEKKRAAFPKPSVGDSCPCCNKTFETPLKKYSALDHNHETGKIRAYICTSCNRVIGLVEEGKRSDQYVLDYLAKLDPTCRTVTERNGDFRTGTREKGEGTRDKGQQRTDRQTEGRPAGPQPNPLIGDRAKRESDGYKLIDEIAALDPERDPVEILAKAAHYEGAQRFKANLASLTDDRLLLTLRDLKQTRDTLKAQTRRAAQKPEADEW